MIVDPFGILRSGYLRRGAGRGWLRDRGGADELTRIFQILEGGVGTFLACPGQTAPSGRRRRRREVAMGLPVATDERRACTGCRRLGPRSAGVSRGGRSAALCQDRRRRSRSRMAPLSQGRPALEPRDCLAQFQSRSVPSCAMPRQGARLAPSRGHNLRLMMAGSRAYGGPTAWLSLTPTAAGMQLDRQKAFGR
jgi:hypothetical protein